MDLIGREIECKALDDLLADARGGLSRTVVVRGEAGVGKTALLDHVADAADDFLIVRLTGVESERDLGYAALHRLLTPMLHQLEELPVPQRDALNSALGLAAGPPANPFLVGLGVISLAAIAASAPEPLLCIIDDAQWLDHESLEALAFWGRRIHAEGIMLVFAVRTATEAAGFLHAFEVIEVDGLDAPAASTLLTLTAGFRLDGDITSRLSAETGGNPLALVELARDLTADQLVGVAAKPQPLQIGRRLEDLFTRRVRQLPAETQLFLLIAAADSTADIGVLSRAASLLGVSEDAGDPAEDAQLFTCEPSIAFRHPLIRSAVYSSARMTDRRAVHRALASAMDANHDAERHVWHLAAACLGANEEVASTLQDRASEADERGSYSAALALLCRSAELTPDPERADARRLAAAETTLKTGSPRQTQVLIDQVKTALRGDARAAADRLAGKALLLLRQPETAASKLASAALAMAAYDPVLSRQCLLEAAEAAILCGDLHIVQAALAEYSERELGTPRSEATIVEPLLHAVAVFAGSGFVAAAPLLRRAVDVAAYEDVTSQEVMRWPALVGITALALWHQDGHDDFFARAVRTCRESAALPMLSIGLQSLGRAEMHAGRFTNADAYNEEGADISRATGDPPIVRQKIDLELIALRGRDAETRAKVAVVNALAEATGFGAILMQSRMALITLCMGSGKYAEALEQAKLIPADSLVSHLMMGDMVEAAVRVGDTSAAEAALDRLTERAVASGTGWALGLLARSQALVAADDGEVFYRSSIEQFSSTRMTVELARSHLVYGEWLRRKARKSDARDQLRISYDMLSTIGAEAFAARARGELLATGERARKRTVETSSDLTPQEARVARLAATGDTNAEIAAQLYISTSTVDYHLRKVFRKLSVGSRRELKRELRSDDAGSSLGISSS
jgi:DNA-binding CsgD family transcriptional regulator